MKLQKTGYVGLKFLFVSLFAGIFPVACHMETSASYLASTERDLVPDVTVVEGNRQIAVHFPKASSNQVHQAKDTGIAEGHALITSSDCYTCHAEYKILLAPSFSEIAARYKNDKLAIQKLANKVISGSIGAWGNQSMPGHHELLHEDAQKMIQYIMNLNKKKDSTKLRL